MKKRILASILSVAVVGCLITGCGNGSDGKNAEQVTLNMAYQYGLAYAPIIVAKEEGFIEEAYKEATGKEVTITWNQMSSGADINTGIAGGSIQVGFMGAAPAITGAMSNVGYKIFTNISGQEFGLMTNTDVKSLQELVGSDKQIALVNIGSIQHITLARALANEGLDPHALDSNIVAMKHPDGMSALQSGSIACHLTNSPYIYSEREDENLTEIEGVNKVTSLEESFIVGVAANSLYEDNKELYDAVCSGMAKAMDEINASPEKVAKLTYELDGNDEETELSYLKKGYYSTATKGCFALAQFMGKNGFIDASPESFSEIAFDNVVGD